MSTKRWSHFRLVMSATPHPTSAKINVDAEIHHEASETQPKDTVLEAIDTEISENFRFIDEELKTVDQPADDHANRYSGFYSAPNRDSCLGKSHWVIFLQSRSKELDRDGVMGRWKYHSGTRVFVYLYERSRRNNLDDRKTKTAIFRVFSLVVVFRQLEIRERKGYWPEPVLLVDRRSGPEISSDQIPYRD